MAKKTKPPAAKKAAAAKKSVKPSAAETAAAAAKAAATRAKKYAEQARKAAEEAQAAANAGVKPKPKGQREPGPPPWQNFQPEIQNGKVGVKVNGVWTDFETWIQGAGSLRLVIGLQPAGGDTPAARTNMTQSLAKVLEFLAKNDRFLRFCARCQSEQGTCPNSD